MKCSKAIIAVAGYGTRRMPVSKSIEKCMLPFGNRPVVDYLVEDCVKSGITDIYFIVSGPANQLRDYYSRNVAIEKYLQGKDKADLLAAIKPPDGVTFHYIEQDLSDGRYGTTVPVWLARDYVSDDEMVLVLMGDAIFRAADGSSDVVSMVQAEKPAVLGVRAPDDADLSKTGGVLSLDNDGNFRAIVEHADPAVEPSRIKNSGFYLLPGSVMDLATGQIESNNVAYNGEFFFTEVVNDLAKQHTMTVLEATGEFLDAGSLDSWVRANQWMLDNSLL